MRRAVALALLSAVASILLGAAGYGYVSAARIWLHVHHAPLPALPAPRYSAECALGDMDQDEMHDADLDRAASRCWEDV